MIEPSRRILIPLPDHDFDPTESATPWRVFTDRGWKVTFATENGSVAAADERLLMGIVRGPLGAGPKGLANYQAMGQTPEFQNPIRYQDIQVEEYDAVSLTGGHAPGMKQYLESRVLQEKMVEFFRRDKVIGAICHGMLVLARAIDPATGRSVLYDYRMTGLTKNLEMAGYGLTFWLHGRRYRTYDCYVADEVKGVLKDPKKFVSTWAMLIPFVVEDRNLVTSRWPLDARLYSLKLVELISARSQGREINSGT